MRAPPVPIRARGLSPTGRGAPRRGMCLSPPRAGSELYARDLQRGSPQSEGRVPRRPSRPIPSTVEAPQRHGPLGVRASGGANSTSLTALPSAAAGYSWSDAPVSLRHTHPFMAVQRRVARLTGAGANSCAIPFTGIAGADREGCYWRARIALRCSDRCCIT